MPFIFVGFRVAFPPLFSPDLWLLLDGGMCLCGGRKLGPSWPSFVGCQPSSSSPAHRWHGEDSGWSERRRLNLSQQGYHHVAPLHISGIWRQMVPSVAQGNAGQTRWWGKLRRLSLPTDGQVLYLSTSYERHFQLAALESPTWHGDMVVK